MDKWLDLYNYYSSGPNDFLLLVQKLYSVMNENMEPCLNVNIEKFLNCQFFITKTESFYFKWF